MVRYTDSKMERVENPTRDAVAARKALFSQPAQAPQEDYRKSGNFSPRARQAVSTDLKVYYMHTHIPVHISMPTLVNLQPV